MFERTTFVGLDVHKANIFVTMLRPGCEPLEWSLLNQLPRVWGRSGVLLRLS